MSEKGSLACVGVGMLLGAHLAPRARAHILQADVVFLAVSDPLVELWIQEMHADVRSLQPFYAEGKSRRVTYDEMTEAMLAEVRKGRNVCGAFYGHPGVFARVPHEAIAKARGEGYPAVMEPGISAEDCLYADLGIDPGDFGCQHYEASQFMLYRRTIDPSAYLILWQIGVAGDRTLKSRGTGSAHRRILLDLLCTENGPYAWDHEVILYEAATLAIAEPLVRRFALKDLVDQSIGMAETLIIPPARKMQVNHVVAKKLRGIETDKASRDVLENV